MFYLMFFHPRFKKWMIGMEGQDLHWLIEYAKDFHDTLKVAMMIVNENNDTLAFFESMNINKKVPFE